MFFQCADEHGADAPPLMRRINRQWVQLPAMAIDLVLDSPNPAAHFAIFQGRKAEAALFAALGDLRACGFRGVIGGRHMGECAHENLCGVATLFHIELFERDDFDHK